MIPFIINTIIGLTLMLHGALIFMESRRGENLVAWVRKQGQAVFGEDWHVHEYIVAVVLCVMGFFFVFVAFSMYAGWHDWWVLKWL